MQEIKIGNLDVLYIPRFDVFYVYKDKLYVDLERADPKVFDVLLNKEAYPPKFPFEEFKEYLYTVKSKNEQRIRVREIIRKTKYINFFGISIPKFWQHH